MWNLWDFLIASCWNLQLLIWCCHAENPQNCKNMYCWVFGILRIGLSGLQCWVSSCRVQGAWYCASLSYSVVQWPDQSNTLTISNWTQKILIHLDVFLQTLSMLCYMWKTNTTKHPFKWTLRPPLSQTSLDWSPPWMGMSCHSQTQKRDQSTVVYSI